MAELCVLPPNLQIDPTNPFQPDLFELKPLADGLTNLVTSLSQPVVIALDGEWGSGKSIFLKQWKAHLEGSENPHPVIYFDAFENDYVDDAFAVLAREVLMLLEEKSTDDEILSFKKKATACGMVLLKVGAKLATRAAVRAATAGLLAEGDLSGVKTDLESEAGDAAATLMAHLLDSPKQQKEIIDSFRDALARLPKVLSPQREDSYPLIFIIDELDRCRPAFALSLLERIKHFMSVPNVHFVLGVHVKQLQNSVRGEYGPEIDASTYLQKFISLSVPIRLNDGGQRQDKQARYVDYLFKNIPVTGNAAQKIGQCKDPLSRIATANNMSLRMIERVYSHLVLAATFRSESLLAIPFFISGLCCLKIMKPDLYENAKTKRLAFRDVEEFLALKVGSDRAPPKHEREAWMDVLDGVQPERVSNYGSILFNTNASTPQDLVPMIAKEVIDSFDP